MCLGQNDSVNFGEIMRSSNNDDALTALINEALLNKPKEHDFSINKKSKNPSVNRHMSVTGG